MDPTQLLFEWMMYEYIFDEEEEDEDE